MSLSSTILFTHSYFLRFDPKQWKTGQPYAPLGTLYAAALLREAGYPVALFDTMFATSAEEITPAITQHRPRFLVIYDDGFNYLTKMCLTNMREAAFRMMQLGKEKGCTVIVASSDATDHYEAYLQAGADFVLPGEAEHTLLELVQAIEQQQTDYHTIHGLAYQQQQQVLKTPPRNVLKFLDGLPFPAWDLVNIAPYRNMWLQHAGYFSINMATTRGCPFKCNWCAKPIYGNRYNSRSPENVIQEIQLLKERFQFDHIWFCDDIFGLKPGWVNTFAQLTATAGLTFRYKIQSRADLLEENYIQDLARSGCDNIWIGAESGSQQILDAMDKGTTIAQIRSATKLIRQYGMHPSFFIQFGYLGETRQDIQQTIHMINELLPSSIGISVSYPLPGTRFHEKVKTQLTLKSNWTHSDEMALMFRNTYAPAFYKHLHKYVHHTYQQHLVAHTLASTLQRPAQLRPRHVKKVMQLLYLLPATFFAKIKLNRLQKLPNA
ncbi:B12-binding domain-containing radical SAM protein [Filimonas lacunae]|nr:radical SAM protein [Filimonas lacunae]BAV05563.1 radical SAM domain protein [Filimonas lacunae]